MDREPCRERGVVRCTACSVATSSGHDEFGPVYRSASRLGNLRQIRRGLGTLDGVDAFQTLSPAVRDAYAAFDFPVDRMSVVPNPLDERFLVDHTSDFEPPYDLLYVGALDRHKGVERLVPVLERVREAGIDARLTVVGDGGRRSAMEREVHERGLDEFVTLSGRLPYAELPAVYARHDLFVYPGRWDDPSPRVVLEALSAGTPVVGTEVGGVPAAVGEAGVLADSSVGGLSDAIAVAVREHGLASLSERTHAELGPYRRDRVVDALESLYCGRSVPVEFGESGAPVGDGPASDSAGSG
jgi:glycosyltransferase involved in cell wall biosynthesis